MTAQRLIVFTRCPDPGQCKTRLIPALGTNGATALHEALVTRTFQWVAPLVQGEDVSVEVQYTGWNLDRLKALGAANSSTIRFRPQGAGDLGQRLAAAFECAFADGCTKVAIVGTDCPHLDRLTIETAFQRLDSAEVVLGPAADGGYYLIALRRHAPELFRDIAWGGSQVLADTMQRSLESGLTTELLTVLEDIDDPEDLSICRDLGIIPT